MIKMTTLLNLSGGNTPVLLQEPKDGERLLSHSITGLPALREPDKYPVIAAIIGLMHENKWRYGILYGYLLHRFQHLPHRHPFWYARSQGPNGEMARAILRDTPDSERFQQEVVAWKNSMGGFIVRCPNQGAVFLGWMLDKLPPELRAHSDAFHHATGIRPQERKESLLNANRRRWLRE